MTITLDSRISPDSVHESLGNWILVDGYPFVCDLEKSSGATLFDSRSGKEYLDFFGCFGSTPIGWNHPALRNPDFLNRAANAVVNKPANSDVYTSEMAEFVNTFGEIAVPDDYHHLFFVDGGALAVENALKVAFDWKIRRNRAKGIDADVGTKVLHFEKAFHGRSGYTLSLTNTLPDKIDYFPKFEDWPRVPAPAVSFPCEDVNLEAVIQAEADSLSAIDKAFECHGDDIAAILIETIQCEGGDCHFRPDYLQALQGRCEKYDCLFILDEVQTGFFASGKAWAWEHYGIRPDIWSFGKKSQQCGIVAGPKIDLVPGNCFETSSRINSTWGGNLVDMVRFRIILETIEKFKLLNNAKNMGNYLIQKIKFLEDSFPGFVLNSRGRGLFAAFDLPSTTERDRVINRSYKNKLLILSSGDYSVRFRPHLTVTEKEIDIAIDILYKSIKEILN